MSSVKHVETGGRQCVCVCEKVTGYSQKWDICNELKGLSPTINCPSSEL